MSRFFIVWNSTRTEGFITDDKRDADAAFTGAPYRAEGFLVQSTIGAEFHEHYAEDGLHLQEIEIEIPAA